jgi:hypothetical protein
MPPFSKRRLKKCVKTQKDVRKSVNLHKKTSEKV